jgi:hypothetical protein
VPSERELCKFSVTRIVLQWRGSNGWDLLIVTEHAERETIKAVAVTNNVLVYDVVPQNN